MFLLYERLRPRLTMGLARLDPEKVDAGPYTRLRELPSLRVLNVRRILLRPEAQEILEELERRGVRIFR